MSTIDTYGQATKKKADVSGDLLREEIMINAKNFKLSWTALGQALYPVWKDKLFYSWGYEKFEHYTEKELGMKKQTALKILKNYFFLEQEEPAYLEKDFGESRPAINVPNYDAVDVLRLARQKKELNRSDYMKLKEAVFSKGKDASAVRRDLTTLMKERKVVDPEQERDDRNVAALRRFLNAVRSFKRDMDALKLTPADVIKDVDQLMEKLEKELP